MIVTLQEVLPENQAFLDGLNRPAESFRIPEGETIACRCEEVTAGAVRRAAPRGHAPPRGGQRADFASVGGH